MRIAVDLLWVKHKQVGGIESYVRNLLDGFVNLPSDFFFILLVSRDNRDSFIGYSEDKRIKVVECPVISTNLLPTVLWENFRLDGLITSLSVDFCFIPYYRCPILPIKNRYLIVLHDLNALHFPKYFSKGKYYWLKYYWKYSLNRAYRIVAISDFVRNDIIDKYGVDSQKLKVIYNPISRNLPLVDFELLGKKFGIGNGNYLYTVSSLHRHKNLLTLLKMMSVLRDKMNNPPKLVISGISSGGTGELPDYICHNGLEHLCIFTGFVSDEERNTLMKHCRLFLYPSVFEGFGMPPIEAKRLGTKVVTTKCASIPEVTMNKLTYVDNPYDAEEWAQLVMNSDSVKQEREDYQCYDVETVAFNYYSLFQDIISS
ncbi:MAG: glycosyltransferase family 4 protein [Bacteroidaceae bacterium]|nr:glycosyltransferase family 4 protein [Bacteroidaceae bacterium]